MKSVNPKRWLLIHTKKYLAGVIMLAVLGAISSLGYVALALISKQAIDIATKDSTGSIVVPLFYIAIIIICQTLIRFICNSVRVRISGKLDIDLKAHMLKIIIKKQYSNIYKMHSGEILNRLTSDIDVIVNGFVGIIPQAAAMITQIGSALVVLIIIDKIFAVIIAALGITLCILGRFYSRKYKSLHKECQQSMGVVRSFLQECFMNLSVIKTFPDKSTLDDRLENDMDVNYKLKLKRNLLSNLGSTGVFLLFTSGYYITLAWGALQISTGLMTYGTLMAFLQIVSQIRSPFYNMSGVLPQYYSMLASSERLHEFEAMNDEKQNSILIKSDSQYKKIISIDAHNLSFKYDDDDYIVENSSFSVQKGNIIAITGASGTGKSTLFKLLLGLFEPTNGTLSFKTLDGDIAISSATRSLFSYVPQGNMILSGTIRENILLCNRLADDDLLVKVTKCAQIYDFITSLPDGFDTVIGERGTGLSEGQVQRIAVARALSLNTPILLLDECTSALDEETEKTLLCNISQLNDRTVFFISHRTSTLGICTSIINLDNKKYTLQQ